MAGTSWDGYDPSIYSATRYSYNTTNTADRAQHILKCYHEVFQTLPSGLKVLDCGTGPILLSTISAATKASEIVLSDFSDATCKAIRCWLDGDATAFDWSPHFGYVVRELEGKGEEEVKKRQERVCKVVKAVIHCDLTQDPPIENGYVQLYDVVICSLVLEIAAKNHEEFYANAVRVSKLVKPGGHMLIYHSVEEDKSREFAVVDGKKFHDLWVPVDVLLNAFKSAGITDLVVVSTYQLKGIDRKVTFSFITGVKVQ